MVGPQRCLDNARGHGSHANPKLLIESGQRSHETADGVFGGHVYRSSKSRSLACNTGYVDDMFGFLVATIFEEMGNGELGGADRVSDVNVNQGITTPSR